MDFHRIAKLTEKFVTDNSPAIMTGIGVTGTLTTAWLASKASFKAAKVLEEEKQHRNIKRLATEPRANLERKEQFKLVWMMYIPAATVGTVTIGAIIFANRIGTRRTAAMAAAYSISEKAFVEYKDKVVQQIGEKKEQAVRDEIAQDRVLKHPPGDFVVLHPGKQLCMDATTNQPFESDYETIRRAVNDINEQILHHDYARVTDFYSMLNIPPTSNSDYMGWNTDKLLEIQYTATLTEDNRPCLVIDFATVPMLNPWQFR